MTDTTETKVREWALRRNGDPLTAHDAVELILAVDEDSVARHSSLVGIFQDHCAEASMRNKDIADLKAWRHESSIACPALIGEAVADSDARHLEFHNAHMVTDHAMRRVGDPTGSDWTDERSGGERIESAEEANAARGQVQTDDRRVWVMWGVGLFLTTIIANSVVVWFIVRGLEEVAK